MVFQDQCRLKVEKDSSSAKLIHLKTHKSINMKKQINVVTLISLLLLVSCNNAKKSKIHSHDDLYTHAHSEDHTHPENQDYFGAYELKDDKFGTKTIVTLSNDKRVMVTNALPNHETGDFPNPGNPNTISAQETTYEFPMNPKYLGKAQWIREPGIAVNGIKFEPGTAEVVECDTGENYRVEALQDVIDLGLDFNHAHVQPTGAYHYHGTPTSVINHNDSGEDLVHVGFAHDGFPMYYSKSGKYKPSFKPLNGNREGEDCTYENPHQSMDIAVGGHHDGTFTSDYEFVEGYGDLDECNGISIEGKYMYLVTDEFPYVSRCLMGEVDEQSQRKSGMQGGQGKRQEGSLSMDQLLERMDDNNDGKLSKTEVKGPLVTDFSIIDLNEDGFLTIEELEKLPKRKR